MDKSEKYKDEIKKVCLLEELAKEIVNKVNTDESTFEILQQIMYCYSHLLKLSYR